MKTPLLNKGLYAITPDISDAEVLLKKVEQALQGGVALLQYRDKISSANEKLDRAKALHSLCLKYRVPLIINDDAEMALECGAEGVHLGQSDGSIHEARELLGEKAIIGATCHHQVELALTAEQQGANYVAFGRFFNSQTKPGAPLASVETLIKAKSNLSIPLVAIGGINHDNAGSLINAGADYIAVVEKIFLADDVTLNCQRFCCLF
ncbi:MAG: thiamine phosphate synthase [Cycloclasticus sp.]|nr:thiamine phosphate synthase [Cycloclasticus sp.]